MAESAPRPILHGSNISPYVRKVRVALAYKGIEYDDVQQIPFGAPPEFVAKSPLSKIPCWEEGELILPDSSVILSNTSTATRIRRCCPLLRVRVRGHSGSRSMPIQRLRWRWRVCSSSAW